MEKLRSQTEHNGSNSTDKISELPHPILHHILSFLPEKCATQTSVLSKPWLHIWSTRSKIELCKSDFARNSDLFLSALDKLFQRYRDQNLSIQELCVQGVFDSESISVLHKWIPRVKLFSLRICSCWGCDIPLSVLAAESLRKLHLEGCTLIHQNPSSIGKFKHLQTLHLIQVRINNEAFEKMVSSCPSLESLTLDNMEISKDYFNFLSSNHLSDLEYLNLHRCYGFTEFHLFSRSIKHLIIVNDWNDHVTRATIDASSILYFIYTSSFIPSISFKTPTCRDRAWKSDIHLSYEVVDVDSSWLFKLNKLITALSCSEITLTLHRSQWKEVE